MFIFSKVFPSKPSRELDAVIKLLALADLDIDLKIPVFVVAKDSDQIIGCAGIDNNVIKCVAVHPDYRGQNVTLPLLDEAIKLADEMGFHHLFLYTKPDSVEFFKSCGFYPIIEAPGLASLMENTPVGISRYCQQLQKQYKKGKMISAIVMNANPFTLGHRYLIETAAKQSDWLHIFVVNEDASEFSFDDRLQLVIGGVSDLKNVSVHSTSYYMVSKATFPSYFIKDEEKVTFASEAIDLLIFRNYIAPALGITHRFVGTEPSSQVTNHYNQSMKYWLQTVSDNCYPSIDVIELERKEIASSAISASRVRALLKDGDLESIKQIVPDSTFEFLKQFHKKNMDN